MSVEVQLGSVEDIWLNLVQLDGGTSLRQAGAATSVFVPELIWSWAFLRLTLAQVVCRIPLETIRAFLGTLPAFTELQIEIVARQALLDILDTFAQASFPEVARLALFGFASAPTLILVPVGRLLIWISERGSDDAILVNNEV
jgi:hypothetical protein